MYLRDYVEFPNGDPMLGWKWNNLENIPLLEDEKMEFRNTLVFGVVTFKNGRDALTWVGASSGEYRVKDGYLKLISGHQWEKTELLIHLCWDKECLAKEGMFLWVALQTRILTADRFKNLGFEGPSRCPL